MAAIFSGTSGRNPEASQQKDRSPDKKERTQQLIADMIRSRTAWRRLIAANPLVQHDIIRILERIADDPKVPLYLVRVTTETDAGECETNRQDVRDRIQKTVQSIAPLQKDQRDLLKEYPHDTSALLLDAFRNTSDKICRLLETVQVHEDLFRRKMKIDGTVYACRNMASMIRWCNPANESDAQRRWNAQILGEPMELYLERRDETTTLYRQWQYYLNALISLNKGLVFSMIKNQSLRPDLSKDQKLSYGLQGLQRACERFCPGRGFDFSTYATRCIWREICKAPYSRPDGVRISPSQAGIITEAINDYWRRNGEMPSNEILARSTGIPLQEIEIMRPETTGDAFYEDSLEDPLADSPPDTLESTLYDDSIACALSQLPEMQRICICLKFGLLHLVSGIVSDMDARKIPRKPNGTYEEQHIAAYLCLKRPQNVQGFVRRGLAALQKIMAPDTDEDGAKKHPCRE